MSLKKVKCEFCKILFLKQSSQIKTKNFCSRSCSAKYNGSKHPKRKLTNRCKNCKNLIYSQLKYCSFKCQKEYNKKDIPNSIICYYCNIEKPLSEYYKSRGKIQKFCKKCSIKSGKVRQREFKTECVKYKGGKCIKCGYNKCIAALDFHHREQNNKSFGIATVRLTSWNKNKHKIIPELDKCDLLCKNCHAEKHYNN